MVGLSRRRFIEVFTEDVGMTPKRYAMVRRFQRALALALHGAAPAWARIAAETGYSDQAHLCRDWAELARLSPRELLALRGVPAKEHHVALPMQGSNPSKTGRRPVATFPPGEPSCLEATEDGSRSGSRSDFSRRAPPMEDR
jgi:AraC-like DNA-binding protein